MSEHAPWVLLRGLTRDARHWRDLPARLEARLPGRRIVCLDLPGNGSLARQHSPAAMSGYVAACRDALAHADVDAPCHLLAMSLGAMVAVDWARRHPREVASCVLVNTSLRRIAGPLQRLRPRALPHLLRALATDDALVRERAVLAATSRRFLPHTCDGDAVARAWAALHRDAPVSRANALRQLLAAARYACDAPPRVRGLLLASTRDALVDVHCSRRLARAWDWPLCEHPEAGHDLPLDDPAWVVERVAWASSIAGGAHAPALPACA